MKAVIMAGGFGTRLRPLTTHIPKPLVPVGNVPIMEHTVRLLKRHGFTDLRCSSTSCPRPSPATSETAAAGVCA